MQDTIGARDRSNQVMHMAGVQRLGEYGAKRKTTEARTSRGKGLVFVHHLPVSVFVNSPYSGDYIHHWRQQNLRGSRAAC
jgi:hypothetical protein